MKQTELRLSAEDRVAVGSIRSKVCTIQERSIVRISWPRWLRAYLKAQILAVLGAGRTALWRTRAAYVEGLALAVFDGGPSW